MKSDVAKKLFYVSEGSMDGDEVTSSLWVKPETTFSEAEELIGTIQAVSTARINFIGWKNNDRNLVMIGSGKPTTPAFSILGWTVWMRVPYMYPHDDKAMLDKYRRAHSVWFSIPFANPLMIVDYIEVDLKAGPWANLQSALTKYYAYPAAAGSRIEYLPPKIFDIRFKVSRTIKFVRAVKAAQK